MPTNDVIARLIPEQGIRAELDTLYLYKDVQDLAEVAYTGSYNDLIDKPVMPEPQVNADWDATSGLAEILHKPVLATVATTGDYNDLSNKPSIPAAQVNADWNADSGVAEILNKPTIPTVNDATITIKQGNTTKGSFSLNQSSGDTITIDEGAIYTAGTGISISNNEISVGSSVLINTSTNSTGLTIKGTPTTASGAVNIGPYTQATYDCVAIGYAAKTGSSYSVAIGSGAQTVPVGAIAIGPKAKVSAMGAIQLNAAADNVVKENSDMNTFKVGNTIGNYELMSADGTVPADRLSHAINKYSTMPTASATNVGWIVQYTGTTDANYTHGYIYECVSDGEETPTYSWSAVQVQNIPNELPSQSGNNGKFLTTDGTTASWSDKPLINIATGLDSVSVSGDVATSSYAVNVGFRSYAATDGIALGYYARTGNYLGAVALGRCSAANGSSAIALGNYAIAGGSYSVAIGCEAKTAANYAIQISAKYGYTNSDANTFKVANNNGNFEIMSADGTIPLARFTTIPVVAGSYAATITIDSQNNVTRSWSSLATVATTGDYNDLINKPTIPDTTNMQVTTNLVTSVSSSSTDTQYPSAKLFYDTCGDIETLINAL